MNARPNRVKQKLAAGETVCVAGGLDNSDMIDQFGSTGLFDGIWLEGEHGPVDFNDIADLTRACDLWGLSSIYRVNHNEQSVIYRALDRGVQGICVPHVNTRAEAENVVAGGKFAPVGQRGMFGSRQGFGVTNYLKVANDHTFLMVLIEDVIAIENLDEILDVDHIDTFYVAPADLAASMGHIGNIEHPEVQDTVDRSLARIHERGRVSGTLTNNDNVAKYAAAGVQFLFTVVAPWIAAGAREFVKQVANANRPTRS
ncbi:MAG: aldolase/citrate lyase family protein [Planctomycetota bacterium]|nr:aldolase/citrate lyase family protein [Planctomycetota bacterium]